jgi:hypothetical protein
MIDSIFDSFFGLDLWQWAGILFVVTAIFAGDWYCYFQGKLAGLAKGVTEGYHQGYLRGYEEGFERGLTDQIGKERALALTAMLRENVAKKIEDKIRAEYRNGTRQ